MRISRLHFTCLLSVVLLYSVPAKCQERIAEFDDGTTLNYTIIDSTVRQMHKVRFDIGAPITIAYFNPVQKILAEAWAGSNDAICGADVFYFLAKSKKVKKVKATAKEAPAGTAFGGNVYLTKSYSIPMEFEKVRHYAVHFQYSQAGNYINNYPAIPELSLGGAMVTCWGLKYMIRDKQMENTRWALRTYRAENLHCLGIDLLYYPVSPSAWDWNRTYNFNNSTDFKQIGVKIYIKGWLPFWSHRDFSFYYLFGLENTFYGLSALGGFGFGGGY